MSAPLPPQLDAAKAQLSQALQAVEGRPIDLGAVGWADLEKSVIKLLGGPFQLQKPEHQVVALGLAAVLGDRLAKDSQGFWFPSRESPEGASLGFPDALVMLSPFGAVVDALLAAKLERLEDVVKDVRTSLGRARFSVQGGQAQRLTPFDYQRLFDPGFVQLVAVDAAKAEKAWSTPPEALARELKDALGRVGNRLPEQLKQQLDAQLVGSLQRLKPGVPLVDQAEQSPRLVELIGHLFGAVTSTGAAPEEFWADVVLPLAFIGAPATFPALEGDELEAAKQGVPPIALFLELVPFQHQSPEDEGLLGAFPFASVAPPHPKLGQLGSLRMVKVGFEALDKPLAALDPAKTKDALARFGEHLAKAAGAPVRSAGPEADQMVDAAIVLLKDLKRLSAEKKPVWLRRLTEAEAGAEVALAEVRQALGAPRIILA